MFDPQKFTEQNFQSKGGVVNTLELYDDGFLRVEHYHYHVACGGKSIKLGRCEFLIFSILARNANRFMPREIIWEHVWRGAKAFNQESLKVFIYNLRRQFAPFGITIETMVNVGYKLISSDKPNNVET